MLSRDSLKTTWKNEYSRYLKSPHWRCLRQRALKDRQNTCEDCGRTFMLEVHHIHYRNPWESCTLADLVVLCHWCHADREYRDPKYPRPNNDLKSASKATIKLIKRSRRHKNSYPRMSKIEKQWQKAEQVRRRQVLFEASYYNRRPRWTHQQTSSGYKRID